MTEKLNVYKLFPCFHSFSVIADRPEAQSDYRDLERQPSTQTTVTDTEVSSTILFFVSRHAKEIDRNNEFGIKPARIVGEKGSVKDAVKFVLQSFFFFLCSSVDFRVS